MTDQLTTREALSAALQRLAVQPPMMQPDQPTMSRRLRPVTTPRWDEVVELRRRASDQVTAAIAAWEADNARVMPDDDRRVLGRSVVRQVVARRARELATSGTLLWDANDEQVHTQAVMDAMFGYGRLQPLFEIPDAENIEIHGWDSVVIQYGDGRREQHPPVADSDQELIEAIRFLGETASPPRPFDDAHPTVTIAVGDRFRVHAIGFGLSFRPSVVIRQHILTQISLRELFHGGMMPEPLAAFLHCAVLARKSMVISGDHGTHLFQTTDRWWTLIAPRCAGLERAPPPRWVSRTASPSSAESRGN